jgi:tRNA pseudouridine55 synthase
VSSDTNNAHINDHRPSGIVILNKPAHYTSHDCVQVLRRLTGIKKIGHAGTLDPMAEGVLPICIGSATRIMEYLGGDTKDYRCTMRLGVTTDTMDIWGNETGRTEPGVNKSEIKQALEKFTGVIEQVPPVYSAIKVKGRHLYDYARAGEKVSISPRKVTIYSSTFLSRVGDDVTFGVECSKGTYMRSLCNDIGEALGCGACMSGLVRLRSGVFRIENSITMDELKNMSAEEIFGIMKSPDYPLVYFGRAEMDRETARDLINGKIIDADAVRVEKASECDRMYNMYHEGKFIGTALMSGDGSSLKAHKIFNVCL